MKLISLLLLVLVSLANGCGSPHKDIIDGIEKLGGYAELDGSGNVITVRLGGPKVADADLVPLKELTRLQILHFDNTKITDAGLVNLKGMSSLKELTFMRTQITDAGLVHL